MSESSFEKLPRRGGALKGKKPDQIREELSRVNLDLRRFTGDMLIFVQLLCLDGVLQNQNEVNSFADTVLSVKNMEVNKARGKISEEMSKLIGYDIDIFNDPKSYSSASDIAIESKAWQLLTQVS
jgi:hypothetical protein